MIRKHCLLIALLAVFASQLRCEDELNTDEEIGLMDDYLDRIETDQPIRTGFLKDNYDKYSSCEHKGDINLRVEAYLNKRIGSNADRMKPEEAMHILSDWSKESGDTKDSTECDAIMRRTLSALGSSLEDGLRCSEKSEHILRAAEIMTSFRTSMSALMSGVDQADVVQAPLIDRILRHYKDEHAKVCSQEYAQLADAQINKMDSVDRKHLLAAFGTESLAHLFAKSPKVYIELSLSGADSKDSSGGVDADIARYLLDRLIGVAEKDGRSLVEGGANQAPVASKEKFEAALEQYILEPCRSYVDLMRPLVGPITFDMGSAPAHKRDFPFEVVFLMARNALCESVLLRSKMFSSESFGLLQKRTV